MIKNFTLLLVVVFVTVTARAQFNVGQRLIGGNLSFSNSKTDDYYNNNAETTGTTIFFNPSIAKFRKPNVLVGMGLSYGYNHYEQQYLSSPQFTEATEHSIGINLFAQRFFSLTKNFYFTIQSGGGVSYRRTKRVSTYNNNRTERTTNGYGLDLSVAPGISYQLAPRLLIDLSLNDFLAIAYTHDQSPKGSTPTAMRTEISNFYLSSGLSSMSLSGIGVGFRWFLRSR